MKVADFKEDRKTYDAVERCFERICEAPAKLGDLAPALMPEQPWREIRALGNRLRHEYDLIREDRLWDIIQVDLQGLLARRPFVSAKSELFRLPAHPDALNHDSVSAAGDMSHGLHMDRQRDQATSN
jgi:uncharacterized protein with HEPN domain